MAMEDKRKTRVCKCQNDRAPETVRTVKRLNLGLHTRSIHCTNLDPLIDLKDDDDITLKPLKKVH